MASRLTLRKNKYNPPDNPPCEKPSEEPQKKTYAEIASSSIQTKNTEAPKKTNLKSYSQMASPSIQIFDENDIFKKAIESAIKHNIHVGLSCAKLR